MAVLSDYVSGTISLTNGSVDFTGSGTAWLLAGFKEGDTILDVAGATEFMGVIASIDANGAGTLTKPWEGPTLVDAPYRMRYQPDGSRVSAQARNLVELLGNGNLQAEAQIDGTGGNWLSYYTGAGAKARTALTAKARALLGKTTNEEILTEIGAMAGSMPSARIKGRVAAGVGAAEDLTQAQLRSFLGMSSFFSGLLDDASGAELFANLGSSYLANFAGRLVLPNGFVLQWASTTGGDTSAAWPVAFNLVLGAIAGISNGASISGTEIVSVGISALSNAAVTVRPRYAIPSTIGVAAGQTVFIIAIGY